jgi:sugar (pentulose or hexulose) kinase
MSTDFSIRPVGLPVATPVVPAAGDAARGAVATHLPPTQSVTATEASVSTRNDTQDSSDFVSRQAFFDRAAASVVFQVVDSRTDQVMKQFPDEAVLRRRAYFRTLDLAREASARPLATDRKA